MGANLQILGFDDKIKTVEQAKADFDKRAEQDRYENGHSYSGSFGMLGSLRFVNRVFDSVEAFEAFLEDKQKNDGYLAQVRVIRETNPLKAARLALFSIAWDAEQARKGLIKKPGDANWRKGSAAELKRVLNRYEKAKTKYDVLHAAQVAKSTKTRFVAGGWVSE